MNVKKLVSVSLIALSIFVVTGCGRSASNDTPTDEENTNEVTTTSTKSTASEDQCIELMAYAYKAAEYQSKWDNAAFMVRAQKIAVLEEKYNLNDEEYNRICTSLVLNPNFMTMVQKRMAELE